jgi:phage portal protein BeeE
MVYPPAYQQVLKGLPAVNYSARDIVYRPRNVRAHRVYGFSPVQQVLMTVNIALRRQLWQLDYFTEGSIPDALIGVPQGWTPDQIKQFQDYWDTEFAGDLAKRRRAKFVPGETAAKVVQTKEPQHKDDFDEWLTRIICFAFSVPPQWATKAMNRACPSAIPMAGSGRPKAQAVLSIM